MTNEKIRTYLWPKRVKSRVSDNCIKQHIHRLRKAIAPLNLYIITRRSSKGHYEGGYGVPDCGDKMEGERVDVPTHTPHHPVIRSNAQGAGRGGSGLTLRKTNAEGNVYGFDTIEFLEFNFDGRGDALVRLDGDLGLLSNGDLMYVLFGDPETGVRWYE